MSQALTLARPRHRVWVRVGSDVAQARSVAPVALRAEAARPAVVLAAARGRPGRDGVGAGGITYTQDFEPQNAAGSETWYNPLTLQLKVYNNGAWRPVSPDGGYF